MTRRTRRHTSLGDTLLRLADVIGAFGILGARLIGGLERLVARNTATAREALHEQGLALKNQLTAHKIARCRAGSTVTASTPRSRHCKA